MVTWTDRAWTPRPATNTLNPRLEEVAKEPMSSPMSSDINSLQSSGLPEIADDVMVDGWPPSGAADATSSLSSTSGSTSRVAGSSTSTDMHATIRRLGLSPEDTGITPAILLHRTTCSGREICQTASRWSRPTDIARVPSVQTSRMEEVCAIGTQKLHSTRPEVLHPWWCPPPSTSISTTEHSSAWSSPPDTTTTWRSLTNAALVEFTPD